MGLNHPDDHGGPHDVSEVARRVGDRFAARGFDDEVVDAVRESSEPLAEPVQEHLGQPISVGQSVRHAILMGLGDVDEVALFSRGPIEDNAFKMYTHPEILGDSHRLFPPAALAKAYVYGYWPVSASVCEGSRIPERTDIDTEIPWEFRVLRLVRDPVEDPFQADGEQPDEGFDDGAAVSKFADRVSTDSVDWEDFVPLYRTKMVEAYRVNAVAQAIDWSAFPDLPDARPAVNDRFEVSRNPRVGDFIRRAVLEELEATHPSIINISTGETPWQTDRVSMLVEPSAYDEPGMSTARFYPAVAQQKFTAYGYRPVAGWYDAPVVGHEQNDPHPRRRIEFARGRALRDWCTERLTTTPLFDDEEQLREQSGELLTGLDLLPCLSSQALTYQQLYQRAHEHNGVF